MRSVQGAYSPRTGRIQSINNALRATLSRTFTLYWVSEDGQGEMPMGDYASADEAAAAIPEARAEALAQCGTNAEAADEINAGRWVCSPNDVAEVPEHGCYSVTTPNGHGAYCPICGEVVA